MMSVLNLITNLHTITVAIKALGRVGKLAAIWLGHL